MPPFVLTEAVVIALAKAVEALAVYGTVYLQSQTPEQLKERMQWNIDDINELRATWRKLLALLPGS